MLQIFLSAGNFKDMEELFSRCCIYNRFIELKKEVNLALFFFIHYFGLGKQTGSY
jgi:hypothetical protein